jgi:hypothetical protein
MDFLQALMCIAERDTRLDVQVAQIIEDAYESFVVRGYKTGTPEFSTTARNTLDERTDSARVTAHLFDTFHVVSK